ncbi:MAG: hypothetical protein JRF29_11530, partial [Deltaproteobacteria bacterium]|nr:hypothetical protein [Deltaproteobacteria bacterium]
MPLLTAMLLFLSIIDIKIIAPHVIATDKAPPEHPQNKQSQIDTYKNRQKNLRLEIEKGRQEVEIFTRKESDLINRLNRVELAINKSRRRAAALKQEIKNLDDKISEASKTSEELKKRIQVNQNYVAKRLVAMYKMNRLGKFYLLASAESMHEFIQRKTALEHVLAYDEKVRLELISSQIELNQVLITLAAHKTQKKTSAAEYQQQIELMSRERTTRQRLLSDIRSQKALELAAIEALTQAASELDGKIKSLKSAAKAFDPAENISRLPFSAHE